MSMKKIRFTFDFCLCFSLILMCSESVYAAPPVKLQRVSLQSTDSKCEETACFEFKYTFGSQEVVLNSKSCNSWFVTASTADRYAAEVKNEGKERAGYFLIDGKESLFPKNITFENGFAIDENGHLIISESAMYETLQIMFDQYNSRFEEGTTVFHSTSGRTIFFGTTPEPVANVDLDQEFLEFKKAFLEHRTDVEKVIYTEDVNTDVNTVGDSYIEVDLTTQHMYMYLDGELIVETPVVTGNRSWGMETPEGVWSLLSITRNATLVGPNYRTPVSYWMPFTTRGHGIHDSTWRTSGYGGDIYLYDGSHGCVNTPIDKVAIVFENAYLGMPVITFH